MKHNLLAMSDGSALPSESEEDVGRRVNRGRAGKRRSLSLRWDLAAQCSQAERVYFFSIWRLRRARPNVLVSAS